MSERRYACRIKHCVHTTGSDESRPHTRRASFHLDSRHQITCINRSTVPRNATRVDTFHNIPVTQKRLVHRPISQSHPSCVWQASPGPSSPLSTEENRSSSQGARRYYWMYLSRCTAFAKYMIATGSVLLVGVMRVMWPCPIL